jgi:hypothetical protein
MLSLIKNMMLGGNTEKGHQETQLFSAGMKLAPVVLRYDETNPITNLGGSIHADQVLMTPDVNDPQILEAIQKGKNYRWPIPIYSPTQNVIKMINFRPDNNLIQSNFDRIKAFLDSISVALPEITQNNSGIYNTTILPYFLTLVALQFGGQEQAFAIYSSIKKIIMCFYAGKQPGSGMKLYKG